MSQDSVQNQSPSPIQTPADPDKSTNGPQAEKGVQRASLESQRQRHQMTASTTASATVLFPSTSFHTRSDRIRLDLPHCSRSPNPTLTPNPLLSSHANCDGAPTLAVHAHTYTRATCTCRMPHPMHCRPGEPSPSPCVHPIWPSLSARQKPEKHGRNANTT